MNRRKVLSIAATAALTVASAACTTTSGSAGADPAAKRRAIDASVDEALANLHAKVPESRELTAKAAGVLVFPSVVSAGFIVGGSHGEGALRKAGRSSVYYSTSAASVSLGSRFRMPRSSTAEESERLSCSS